MPEHRGEMSPDQAAGSLLTGFSDELAGVVERAARHVVTVRARRRMPSSGIVWPGEGLVVTADHTVEADEGITIGFPDGASTPAELVGRDPGTDLALLRVKEAGLIAAEVAGAESARVGSLVLAIGRPGEDGPMATVGVVSALAGPWRNRRGGMIDRLIQTDVTMYPGFSGGPLVDAWGRVAGMNSSHLAGGVSMAVPSSLIGSVVQALLSQGRVRRGYLGLRTQTVGLPPDLVQRHNLSQQSGLMVVRVEPGGPAEAAGLMLGDVLVALGGQPVRDADELQGTLGPDRVGASLQAGVIRGGELKDAAPTVGERR
jgi:S1-C subfamily serine protease